MRPRIVSTSNAAPCNRCLAISVLTSCSLACFSAKALSAPARAASARNFAPSASHRASSCWVGSRCFTALSAIALPLSLGCCVRLDRGRRWCGLVLGCELRYRIGRHERNRTDLAVHHIIGALVLHDLCALRSDDEIPLLVLAVKEEVTDNCPGFRIPPQAGAADRAALGLLKIPVDGHYGGNMAAGVVGQSLGVGVKNDLLKLLHQTPLRCIASTRLRGG